MGKIRVHPISGDGLRVATGQFTAEYKVNTAVNVGFQPLFVIVYAAENVYAAGGNSGNRSANTVQVPRVFARGDYSSLDSVLYKPCQVITTNGFQFRFFSYSDQDGEKRTFYYVAVG